MAPLKIVIVGAGWGGQGCCQALAALDAGEAEIVCVDGKEAVDVGATWQFEIGKRAAPLAVPLEQSRAAPYLRRDTVESVDTAAKTVRLAGGASLPYDKLVLACGAVSDPSPIPGLEEHALDVSVKGFAAPIDAFVAGLGGAPKTCLVVVAKTPYKCPPLPFEIAFCVEELARKQGSRGNVKIIVAVPVPWPFGGPKAKAAFTEAMAAKGIEFRANAQLASISDDAGRTVCAFSDVGENGATTPGSDIVADIVLAVYPHRAPDFVPKHLLNPKGSVPVDLRTNAVKALGGDVYSVGDCCAAVLPSVGMPVPKAGEFAYKAGLAVGARLAREIRGEAEVLPTERSAKCVAETGDAAGITVGPTFDACFRDPAEGKPSFIIEPRADGTAAKVAWIQGYLDTFAPDAGLRFAPRS